jgi:hypothetical protein
MPPLWAHQDRGRPARWCAAKRWISRFQLPQRSLSTAAPASARRNSRRLSVQPQASKRRETIAPCKGREWLQGHVVGVTADVRVGKLGHSAMSAQCPDSELALAHECAADMPARVDPRAQERRARCRKHARVVGLHHRKGHVRQRYQLGRRRGQRTDPAAQRMFE